MTPTQEALVELAARVEAAEGADRALDVEITVAIDWRWPEWEEGDLLISAMAAKHGIEWAIERVTNSNTSIWRNLPRFTASLDSALSLVPEGWQGERMSWWAGCPSFCGLVETRFCYGNWTRGAPTLGRVEGRGITPALALTAAALRARAAQDQSS